MDDEFCFRDRNLKKFSVIYCSIINVCSNGHLLKAEKNQGVRLSVEQLRLPCPGQALKVREGDSTGGRLLMQLRGSPDRADPVVSSGPQLLVEFTAGDVLSGDDCNGGFLAHASPTGGSNKPIE